VLSDQIEDEKSTNNGTSTTYLLIEKTILSGEQAYGLKKEDWRDDFGFGPSAALIYNAIHPSTGAAGGDKGAGSEAILERLSQLTETTNERLSQLSKATAMLVQDAETRKFMEDPWTDLSSAGRSDDALRTNIDRVLDFYKLKTLRGSKDMYGFEYSDTDSNSFPGFHQRIAHIWPAKTFGRGLELFDLNYTDINNPRNFLVVPRTVEKFFDAKSICFDYDFIRNRLITNVLDPDIMDEPLFVANPPGAKGPTSKVDRKARAVGSKTLADIHQQPLLLPRMPFRRLLDHQAEHAHRRRSLLSDVPARIAFGNASDTDEKSDKKTSYKRQQSALKLPADSVSLKGTPVSSLGSDSVQSEPKADATLQSAPVAPPRSEQQTPAAKKAHKKKKKKHGGELK